jgi:hypothetical protein
MLLRITLLDRGGVSGLVRLSYRSSSCRVPSPLLYVQKKKTNDLCCSDSIEAQRLESSQTARETRAATK